MVTMEFIFIIGNFTLLIASVPNILKLFRYWDVRSFSKYGALLTWFGLTCFAVFYVLNGMFTSLVLSSPGVVLWASIVGLKFLRGGD